jgi:phage terminase large subunit GpA-like protein
VRWPDCDVLIEEYHKGEMLTNGEWRAHAEGDGETVGFHLNALYSPLGWMDWKSLAKQFEKAKKAQAKGDLEPMQVFYNTRLAKVWDAAQEQTKADVLRARARLECFGLGSLPSAVLMITGSVDVQANRWSLWPWVGASAWSVGWSITRWCRAIPQTSAPGLRWTNCSRLSTAIRAASAWHSRRGRRLRRSPYRRGLSVLPRASLAQRVRHQGASKPGKPVIAQRPSMVDVTWKGQTERNGAELWFVGTDTAKDWIYNRYPFESGRVRFTSPMTYPTNSSTSASRSARSRATYAATSASNGSRVRLSATKHST